MVDPNELERIAAVDHADPHAVLGPHEEDGVLVVRAFRPDAVAITVLPDEPGVAPRRMRRAHGLGVFEARFEDVMRLSGYRLEVRYPTDTFTLRDPYAFPPVLGAIDLHLAAEGTHQELYRHMGAHTREVSGTRGTSFAVWAPNARRVSVVGDFNDWDGRLHAMRRMGSGMWELFIPEVGDGALYKYEIKTPGGRLTLKSDPYAFAMELRPSNASKVTTRRYVFEDDAWMAARREGSARERPLSIYEVHLASWCRLPGLGQDGQPGCWMTYRELADALVDYVVERGFTHVELLPVMEHPYDGSWGYQVVGYFAPTSRYGAPDDLRYFIDRCHQRGVGVLLDWTPAHFPKDDFALGRFDGTALYEHDDPRLGEHREWNTFVFNYGRREVKNFLIANALYWIDEFHVDGLRVDAVASMLYLDYGSKGPHDWVPNKYGGRENLEAIAFIRELSDLVHGRFPGAILCAEESTSWPGVTQATHLGGLGFDFKWNMGWMHDTLDYFKLDPIYRAFSHHLLTFALMYAFSERFLLPLSHDEVVHLKKSLLSKMPGDHWQMLGNLRSLYGYMWAQPGKKLLFMGGEIGQFSEWSERAELDWGLLSLPGHAGLQRLVSDLNALYRRLPAMYELDDVPAGFRWIDANDSSQSVASFIRYGKDAEGEQESPSGVHVVFVGNFTPLPRHVYRVGVPRRCAYLEVLNTDSAEYGGSGMGNLGRVEVEDIPSHGFAQSITLTLPPLGVLWLIPEKEKVPEPEGVTAPAEGEVAKEGEAKEAAAEAEAVVGEAEAAGGAGQGAGQLG